MRYDLTPDRVDCVVFCSKNYAPILPYITRITDRFNTYFHYTITAYGKDLEPGVPSIGESMETLKALSAIVGKQRLAWRYDPVLLTGKYTIRSHIETFNRMARELAPYVDRCIFSFVTMYRKLEHNMPELKAVTEADKEAIAKGLGEIAERHGLYLQTCGTKGDYSRYGIHPSGCMTLEILGRANGVEFRKLKHKGMRQGCHCIESRGIGDYDTCPNGCRYCYANKDHKKALENYKRHDPDSPLLLGHLMETDVVQLGVQETLLRRSAEYGQLSLNF